MQLHFNNIERGFRTYEYKESARILGPISRYLLILVLSLGQVHRPQLSRRIPIVLGQKVYEVRGSSNNEPTYRSSEFPPFFRRRGRCDALQRRARPQGPYRGRIGGF